MLGRRACLAALWVVPLAACYSPPEPACGFVCGPDGSCPEDYTCASENICHRNGTPASLTCTTPPVPFDVTTAAAASNVALTVTFSDPPDPTNATALASYDVPGLSLSGTPALSGSTVTLATSPQAAQSYTLAVTGVQRAADLEPLTTTMATFTGVTCSDMMQNGDETDVDCGGAICSACADGLMCLAPTDCQSMNCAMNVCAP